MAFAARTVKWYGGRFVSFANGLSDEVCAIDGNGRGWCWGSNALGMAGIPGPTFYPVATPTQLNTRQRFAKIAVDLRYACGITSEGLFFCWGQSFGNGPAYVPIP